jgi:hypothetical protein
MAIAERFQEIIATPLNGAEGVVTPLANKT